jgi:hypothetical protein
MEAIMADVTIILSEQEAAFVKYILDSTTDHLYNEYERTKKVLNNNGSLEGKFGSAVKHADQAVLDAFLDSVEDYESLALKF